MSNILFFYNSINTFFKVPWKNPIITSNNGWMFLDDELRSSFFMLAQLKLAQEFFKHSPKYIEALDVHEQAGAWRNIHLYDIQFKFSLIRKYTG